MYLKGKTQPCLVAGPPLVLHRPGLVLGRVVLAVAVVDAEVVEVEVGLVDEVVVSSSTS